MKRTMKNYFNIIQLKKSWIDLSLSVFREATIYNINAGLKSLLS